MKKLKKNQELIEIIVSSSTPTETEVMVDWIIEMVYFLAKFNKKEAPVIYRRKLND